MFLPLILLCIFLIIAIGVALNARGSLANGMTASLRLAHTRGDSTRVGLDILPAIQTIHSGTPSETARRLLTSLPDAERADGLDLLDSCFGAVYNRSLRSLPNQYLYALVYLNQALAQSIGSSFRFPCLPPGANAPNGCGGNADRNPGCGICYLFDPDNPTAQESGAPLRPDRIAIRCEYAPSSVFIDPIIKLLGLFGLGDTAGGIFTMRRERLFDAEELGL